MNIEFAILVERYPFTDGDRIAICPYFFSALGDTFLKIHLASHSKNVRTEIK
tara:strand:+ start:7785 stop:7940 length:156 start_codon:yes stop_codon:yes gene_type:complete